MDSKARAEIDKSMAEAVKYGQMEFQKWNEKEYSRAPFLLVSVCDEKYRRGVASLVTKLLYGGVGGELAAIDALQVS